MKSYVTGQEVKMIPSARTAKRHWLNEGQGYFVTVRRQRGDRVTVVTESGAVITVSAIKELC